MAMVDMEPPKPAQPSLELEPGANAYSGTAAPPLQFALVFGTRRVEPDPIKPTEQIL